MAILLSDITTISDDREERIAIIADGCHVSQTQAKQMEYWAVRISELRQKQLEQKLRAAQKRGLVDFKSLAAGE